MSKELLCGLLALPIMVLVAVFGLIKSRVRWLCGLAAVALTVYAALYCFELVPPLPKSFAPLTIEPSPTALPSVAPAVRGSLPVADSAGFGHKTQTPGRPAAPCYHIRLINRTESAIRYETSADGFTWNRKNLPPETFAPTCYWASPDRAVIRYVPYQGGPRSTQPEWQVEPQSFAHKGNSDEVNDWTAPLYEFVTNEQGLVTLRRTTKEPREVKDTVFRAKFQNTTEFTFAIEFHHDHGFHEYRLGARGAIDDTWVEPREGEDDREIIVQIKSGQKEIFAAAKYWKAIAGRHPMPVFQFYLTDQGTINLRGPGVLSEQVPFRHRVFPPAETTSSRDLQTAPGRYYAVIINKANRVVRYVVQAEDVLLGYTLSPPHKDSDHAELHGWDDPQQATVEYKGGKLLVRPKRVDSTLSPEEAIKSGVPVYKFVDGRNGEPFLEAP